MADEDYVDITDFLSEQEIDLINYLRGFTEEGDAAPGKWSVKIERLPDRRWRVIHEHGDDLAIGEGFIFDDAWVDQCHPMLREPLKSSQEPKALSLEARPSQAKPRLRARRRIGASF